MLLVYIGSKKIQEKHRHELPKAIKHSDAVSGAGCCLSHGSSDTIMASSTSITVCLLVWSGDLLKTSFISYCRRWDTRLGGSATGGCLVHSCCHYSTVTPTKANEEASLVFSKELDQSMI